jgi:splicing factor 1
MICFTFYFICLRLEDLHGKIVAEQLELGDPDLRGPSPPAQYDKFGTRFGDFLEIIVIVCFFRINKRDDRVRRAMDSEYQNLIRFMEKTIPGYVAPSTFKRKNLVKIQFLMYCTFFCILL